MPLEFHPLVDREIEAIQAHYRQVSNVAAGAFEFELLSVFARMEATPRVFACRHGDIRRANLTKFPYHILFRVEGNIVRVLTVRHDRRAPHYGLSRR